MNKFTPGPYSLPSVPDWYGFEARFYTVINSANEIVAFIKEWKGGESESKATAQLFSAAPDLLEALIEVTASLAWNAHGECRAIHDGPILPSNGAVEMARAAIAKATA